ncbi:MAG TPA: ABC transporter substrate-binding protein, partial [Candidatus Acidoferrum sp.]|nr:ABC transporter substrate-binding protein [Candidatus Acidoferrum sp.]
MRARFALALLAVALCAATPAPSSAPVVIRVGLVPNDDAATPLLYALHSGMFRQAGLDVRILPESSGAAVTAAVIGGNFDIGKSSVVPLINAHLRGLPIAIVAPASIWNGTSKFAQLLVRRDSPIHSGADLNGKVIGVQALNDMNEIATDAWVEEHGGDAHTLRYVEIPMSAAGAAIENGRIDAAAFVEPQLENALADGRLRALDGAFDAIAPRYLFAAWFSTKAWAREHEATARTFARIVTQAAAYTNAHHAQTVGMVAEFTHIPLPVIERMT